MSYTILDKVKENHIRKTPWLKSLSKTQDPALLADLIAARINDPGKIGPYLPDTSIYKEESTDIIWALIETTEDPNFRKRMSAAVGLLLFKMLNDETKPTTQMLSGVFNIINNSRLDACRTLTWNWLSQNIPVMTDDKHALKVAYREGLMAFARIQARNELTEIFWLNIWRQGTTFWHPVAFMGLRMQNPKLAMNELPLFASRKLDSAAALLSGAWKDENSRNQLECAIKRGLKDQSGQWAGKLLNALLGAIDDEQKEQLMLALKAA
jgi:hypothetical protein